MYNVLLGIDIILAVFLCCLVMLQRSDGGALGGLGGGTGNSFMTGRSVGNALTKATAIIAALFFATSLGLSVLAKQSVKPVEIVKNLPVQTRGTVPPKEEKTDLQKGTKDLFEKLSKTQASENAEEPKVDKVPQAAEQESAGANQ